MACASTAATHTRGSVSSLPTIASCRTFAVGPRRSATRSIPGWRARRWVVEVVEACHSWLNRNRALLIRSSKKPANHLALLQLACGLIAFKKAHAARLAHDLLR